MNKEHIFKDIVSGKSKGLVPHISRSLLGGASQLYKRAVEARNAMYDRRIDDERYVYHASVPVISVGNITVGGTGKTPFVMYLSKYFRSKGLFPVILLRGYKAKDNKHSHIVSDGHSILMKPEESGDEAYLLAKALPHCGVIIGRSRSESAQLAVEKLGAQVLILDDAFQHRKLYRDLDVVLIDCTNPFGYGHVLPRGLLREPLEGLSRAHIIVLTKTDQVEEQVKYHIYQTLKEYAPEAHICETIHASKKIISLGQWMEQRAAHRVSVDDDEAHTPQALFAVCAIGNPQSFLATIRQGGYDVIGSLPYMDHHDFTPIDIQNMIDAAKGTKKAEAIVITEKDAVKLGPKILLAKYQKEFPFYVLPVTIDFTAHREALSKALEDMENSIKTIGLDDMSHI